MSAELIQAEIQESIATKRRMLSDHIAVLALIADTMTAALRGGNKLLFFGNGGSAADAQHIATEFVSKFRRNRQALAAIALTTDTSLLTAIGNDFTFDDVFTRQIEALGMPGDVAFGLSTSGNSRNVVNALQLARARGLITIGFTGADGGQLKDAAEFCFRAPSDSTARIQEAHITAAHAICEVIERELGIPQNR